MQVTCFIERRKARCSILSESEEFEDKEKAIKKMINLESESKLVHHSPVGTNNHRQINCYFIGHHRGNFSVPCHHFLRLLLV